MFKLIATILLVLFAMVASAVTYASWLSSKYGVAFDQTRIGATESDLVGLAGEPFYVTDGTRWVEPQHAKSDGELVPGCVRELWYEVPWVVQKFSFCFDAEGVLLDKYNWVSR